VTHFDLTIATRLIYEGRDFRFEGRRGDEIDWVHDRTNQHLPLTDEELAEIIASGLGRLASPSSRGQATPQSQSVFDPDSLPQEELEQLMRKWDYVQDLWKAGLPPRPPIKKVEAVVLATAERRGEAIAPHWRTVRRWEATLGEHPHIMRLRERHQDKGNRDDRLHPEVREIVERAIDKHWMRRPPIAMPTFQAIIRTEIRNLNLHRAVEDKREIPGAKALWNSIGARDKREVWAARHGEASAAHRYDGVQHQKDPKAPLDLVELDHTVADLFVVSNGLRLPIGRPTICAAIDRCTRMPFGIYVGFEPPSVLTVMQCLKNGILPKTYLRRKVEAGDWQIKNPWPVFGIPRAILVDRALENLGHDLRYNAAGLGITDVRIAGRKDPKRKGAIERFLGTLNRRLLQEQRGTTFSNLLERSDYDPSKNAVITLEQLYEQIHCFLIDVYAFNKRHAGLRDVPARRWNELTRRYPVDPLEDVQEIIPYLGRGIHCGLRRDGVRFKHIVYNSPELAALLSSAQFLSKAGQRPRVAVRYNPADLGSVYVALPHENRFIEVPPVPKWRDYADGVSVWEHKTILNFERDRANREINPDTLADALVSLLADMEGGNRRPQRSKTAKRYARFTGDGRIAPAGDEFATTPSGSTHARRGRDVAASNDQRLTTPPALTVVPGNRRRVQVLKSPGR
jgi:putative transposase